MSNVAKPDEKQEPSAHDGLRDLVKQSSSGQGVVTIYRDARNIPVQITNYIRSEEGNILAEGIDLTSNTNAVHRFDVKVRLDQEGKAKNRSMEQIQEVSPVGSTVIFTNCNFDKQKSCFVASYVRTPQNKVIEDENVTKNVEIIIKPGRAVAFKSGRVGVVTYNFDDGRLPQTKDEVYQLVRQAVESNKGQYLRIRINAENFDHIDCVEFFPEYSILEEGGTRKRFVDVEKSMEKFSNSAWVKSFVDNYDGLKETHGNALQIDFMTSDLTFTGKKAAEKGANNAISRLYGLNKQNGLFSPLTTRKSTPEGPRVFYENVAINVIMAKTQQTNEKGTFSYLTSVDTLSMHVNAIQLKHLPLIVAGQPAYSPDKESIFRRLLKTDGSYYAPSKEQEAEKAASKSAAPVQAPAASAPAQQKLAPKEVADVALPMKEQAAKVDEAIAALEEMEETDFAVVEDFEQTSLHHVDHGVMESEHEEENEMGLEDFDLDKLLDGMSDEKPQSMKM